MSFLESYRGKPYRDSKWPGGPQRISGRLICAYYDAGGEGIAYHDADEVNNGSGKLNPVDGSYLHSFRINEGVDTSYVKFRDSIDSHEFNLVMPEKDMLYVGWTVPGEWICYTVSIEEAGVYTVDLMYTSKEGGRISLEADDGKAVTFEVDSTYDAADPLDWRQWHHWNKALLGEIRLPQGLHVLTLRTVEKGNMNYAYLEFKNKR
jgi:hypothetical protein